MAVTFFGSACTHKPELPEVESQKYAEFCAAFYTGLAGLQSGEDVRAKEDLTKAAELVPAEPAAWANLAIFQLRRQDYDGALQSAERARNLDPENSRIEALLGQIQSTRGDLTESRSHLKKAISLDTRNIRAIYALALEAERQGNEAEAKSALQQALTLHPENLALLLDLARLLAKGGDGLDLRETLKRLQSRSSGWPEAAKTQLGAVQEIANTSDVRAAAVQVQFLRNVLLRVPAYQRNLDDVRTPTTVVFQPFLKFLRLPSPSSEPAAPDVQVRFQRQELASGSSGATWSGAFQVSQDGPVTLLWADSTTLHVGDSLHLPLPAVTHEPLPLHAIASADLNYDFKTDLVLATSGGIRIYQQLDGQHFTDVTNSTKLSTSVINGVYTGAWAFDVDLDGDLDIVLGVKQGEPVVLRNNGDGTFATVQPFKGIDGLLAFAAADIDGDGDPDVAIIDKNQHLTVFSNERLGEYRRRGTPAATSEIESVTAGDVNGDGLMDFVFLRRDLTVGRLSSNLDGVGWDAAELARLASSTFLTQAIDLELADVDNNGALDLIAGDQVFLNDGRRFVALEGRVGASIQAVTDLNQDGHLDLIGLSAAVPLAFINYGAKGYHWATIHTRAANATGDQRINSFGVGGEIELRADLLTQKQMITAPILHFGLGEHKSVDFARIVWPNGFVQAEFALKPDQMVLAQQRLKGSCPLLFTWNGQRMRFVKDTAPWSPALGLHINAQQVAGIYQTEEWFKIPGDQLKPRDGYYDLRVTAEYWETFYIDHYSLMVVDHRVGTQVYSDERFAVPPPALRVYATTTPKPFLSATDDGAADVTQLVSELDGRYLDNFGRGQYQGVTRDHWVELQLPADAPHSGPLYVIADGWMHPSDATTNIALGQNSGEPPRGLSIETQDISGKWVKARRGLGFPAGRVKTIVLDLTNLFPRGGKRNFRLRTNLEIYWDRLAWASGVTPEAMTTTRLNLTSADLQFRGFSDMKQANISSPELPDYNAVVAKGERWRDMQGYFTRYGDVRELLTHIDDRMVIANEGDELQLKFAALQPPAAGWIRDYIMVGDGWIKDGDYNSVFSGTVLPLPYHGMKDYTLAANTLEEDAGYRMHPNDWRTYHTRYVSGAPFVRALWPTGSDQ